LIATDREEEGMNVLKKLHYNGSNGMLLLFMSSPLIHTAWLIKPAGEWIESEFNEIKQTIAAEKAITVPGWRVMFTVKQWRIRLFHGVAVQVFTQLSGISRFPNTVPVRNPY
jgi:hypothetical protein